MMPASVSRAPCGYARATRSAVPSRRGACVQKRGRGARFYASPHCPRHDSEDSSLKSAAAIAAKRRDAGVSQRARSSASLLSRLSMMGSQHAAWRKIFRSRMRATLRRASRAYVHKEVFSKMRRARLMLQPRSRRAVFFILLIV